MGAIAAGILLITIGGQPSQAGSIHASVSFAPEAPLTTPTTQQAFLAAIIVADLTNDGRDDVIAVSQSPGTVAWYQNLGNGTFSERRVISTTLGTPSGVFAGDLDGDTLVDLACSSFLDNTVAWFKNLGGDPGAGLFGNPASNAHPICTVANRGNAVAIANINTTGGLDVLSVSANPYNQVAWYGNLGAGNFGSPTANQIVISTAAISPSSIRVADLNGDNILDLVVTSSNDNTIAWFMGTGNSGGNPQYVRYVIATNQPRAAATAIADIDGDGWLDLFCASPFVGDAVSGPGKRITWFRNTTHDGGATAPFFGAPQLITANVNGAYSVATADINHDGRPDALAASLFDSKVTWYENLGSGNFGWNAGTPAANEKVISSSPLEAVAVVTGDFNQDGNIDVVAGANTQGKIVAYLNLGGQVALSSSDTSPGTIPNGAKDDVLRIAVSSRGIAGDNQAQLFSVSLLLEKSAGVSMSSAEANALIENLQIYADANASGAFEPGADALVGTVGDLQLTVGRLTATLAPANAADAQIAPASTRHFFVVAQMTAEASTLTGKTFRITHVSQGAGRTITKDATSGAVLTLESATNPDAPSAFTTATLSIIQMWRQTWFGTISNSGIAADTANFDGDAFLNLAEFAFGLNPIANSPGAIVVNGSSITPGAPTTVVMNTVDGVDFRALYGRRKDYAAAGLSYAVEFSADLASWTPGTDAPTVIADDGTLQAVTVPYPLFINGNKARFFRVAVTGP